MGIGARVAALQRAAASPERTDALEKAAARLVDATGMGREYKVMGVTAHTIAGTGATEEDVWPFIAGEVVDRGAATGVDGKESTVVRSTKPTTR
jgi:hypothetical protein